MSGRQTRNSSLRKMISLLFILGILGIFLSQYFFKYLPQKQRDFHDRAFGDLRQVDEAFRDRDIAYRHAIGNFLRGTNTVFSGSALNSIFTFTPLRKGITDSTWYRNKDSFWIAPPTISLFSMEGYRLSYEIFKVKNGTKDPKPDFKLSKDLDSTLRSVIPVQEDIFDDYILIRENRIEADSSSSSSKNAAHEGTIVYNSGRLSIDRTINTDTLLKKIDGFSLPNVHDVKIEGNEYKLFLYPFNNYSPGLILAGLISRSHYTQAYESIPMDMLSAVGILLLIILLSLPLLKIYIVGPSERITQWDLRMIIGSYFTAALVGVVLFAGDFLSRIQSNNNESDLAALSGEIRHTLSAEIRDMCAQLRKYDTLVYGGKKDTTIAHILEQASLDTLNNKQLMQRLNDSLKPTRYLQPDNLFWIDSAGTWVARWGFKESLRRMPIINVSDRRYFKDLKNDNLLSLDPSGKDSFCIQPTLGKLDGAYTITVIIRSHAHKRWMSGRSPIMLGMSASMYSLCNPVLPLSYHFSIINNDGQVQFDGLPGKSLLSNIYSEIPDPKELQQYAVYRHKHYFSDFTLRGKKVAMLASPLPNLPYTILTYHDLSEDGIFQSHIIGLSVFFMISILALLILSSLCNELAGAKPRLVKIPHFDFEWLRPVSEKYGYYLHLRRGMLHFFGAYLFTWLMIEWLFKKYEFAFLSISYLLPIYIALHYYLVREKQKAPDRSLSQRMKMAPSACLLIMLSFINLYLVCSDLEIQTICLILSAQILFGTVLYFSDKAKLTGDKSPSPITLSLLLRRYSLAILTGILMAIVVPACSIFFLFYKEETRAVLRQQKIYMVMAAKEKENGLAKKLQDPNFDQDNLLDNAFQHTLIHDRGIYSLDRLSSGISAPLPQGIDFVSSYYSLRNLLFHHDSTAFWGMRSDKAGYFPGRIKDPTRSAYKSKVEMEPTAAMELSLAPTPLVKMLKIALRDLLVLGPRYIILLILILLLFFFLSFLLTNSLAKRIFLLDSLDKYYEGSVRALDDPVNKGPVEKKGEEGDRDTSWIDRLAGRLRAAFNAFEQKQSSREVILDRSDSESLRSYEGGDEGQILIAQSKMKIAYEKIWDHLSPDEKFTLYDFATDGLINYKAGFPLYSLLKKEILFIDPERQLHVMTDSFRNFVLNKSESTEVVQLMARSRKEGSWQSFRVPLLLGLGGVGLFLFFTQADLYQKITGLLASLISLRPLLSPLLGKGGGKDQDNTA